MACAELTQRWGQHRFHLLDSLERLLYRRFNSFRVPGICEQTFGQPVNTVVCQSGKGKSHDILWSPARAEIASPSPSLPEITDSTEGSAGVFFLLIPLLSPNSRARVCLPPVS